MASAWDPRRNMAPLAWYDIIRFNVAWLCKVPAVEYSRAVVPHRVTYEYSVVPAVEQSAAVVPGHTVCMTCAEGPQWHSILRNNVTWFGHGDTCCRAQHN